MMKRSAVFLLAITALALSPVHAETPAIEGHFKTEGQVAGQTTRANIFIAKVTGRRYTVTRNGGRNQDGEREGWEAVGLWNGSRLVVEFPIARSTGLAGVIRGRDATTPSSKVRAVMAFSGDSVKVDYYEVLQPRGRRSLGAEKGRRLSREEAAELLRSGPGSADSTSDADPDSSAATDASEGAGADANEGDATGEGDDASEDNGNATGEGDDASEDHGNATGERDDAGEEDGASDSNDANTRDDTDNSSATDMGLGEGALGDGAASDDESDAREWQPAVEFEILEPRDGSVLLKGQVFEVRTKPEGAKITVTGARAIDDALFQVTASGALELNATIGGTTKSVQLRAIEAEVTKVTVLDSISIIDAPAPHFERALGADAATRSEPAAIYKSKALRLLVTLQAEADLSKSAELRLTASGSGQTLTGEGQVQALASGTTLIVETAGALTDKVTITSLELGFTAGSSQAPSDELNAVALTGGAKLRVYSSYAPPKRNVRRGRAMVNTKFHFEKACEWAEGASENIGNGATSIAWNVDNKMRHFVHPESYGPTAPEVTYYAVDSEAPVNYKDLPGKWGIRNGKRPVSSLYYPPLEPREDYQEYTHFQHNFGWHLLDNKTHTGGRCNQQASLVCDIVGTLGIEASVHYLQRVGQTKDGRPCRQYFYAAGGSGPWNFHGIVRATMHDGSEWLYDGSFSSPPNRLNGERQWAENPGGPFIQKWGPWLYEDVPFREEVEESNHPESWQGIQ